MSHAVGHIRYKWTTGPAPRDMCWSIHEGRSDAHCCDRCLSRSPRQAADPERRGKGSARGGTPDPYKSVNETQVAAAQNCRSSICGAVRDRVFLYSGAPLWGSTRGNSQNWWRPKCLLRSKKTCYCLASTRNRGSKNYQKV